MRTGNISPLQTGGEGWGVTHCPTDTELTEVLEMLDRDPSILLLKYTNRS